MDPNKNSLLRISVWGSIAILVLWTISGFVLYGMPERGTFGDMFGAINSLFSGFAFLALIITITLQYEELKEQRREIMQARIAQEKTARSLEAQLHHSETQSRIKSLNLLIEVQTRILSRITDFNTVSDIKKKRAIQIQISKYEKELESIINEELNADNK